MLFIRSFIRIQKVDHNIWLLNGNYISKLVHQDQSCYSCFVLLIHFFFIVISAFSLLYWRFHCYIGVFNCCSNIYVPFVLVIPFVFLLNVQCKTEFNIRRILFLSKLSVKSLAKSFGNCCKNCFCNRPCYSAI